MAGRVTRLDTVTWIVLFCTTVGWLTALTGLGLAQRDYREQGHDSTKVFQFQWWLITYQFFCLAFAAAVTKHRCYGSRNAVACLLAVCVPLLMLQADISNSQLQASASGDADSSGDVAWPAGTAMAPSGFQQFEATVAPTAQSIASTAVQTASSVSSQMPAIPLEVLTNVVKGISQGLATASLSNGQNAASNAQLMAAMSGAPTAGFSFYATTPAPSAQFLGVQAPAPRPGRRHLLTTFPRTVRALLPSPDAPAPTSNVLFAGYVMLAICDTLLLILYAVAHPEAERSSAIVRASEEVALAGIASGRPTPRQGLGVGAGGGGAPPVGAPPRSWCCQQCGSGDLGPAPASGRSAVHLPERHASDAHSYASGKLAFMMAAVAASSAKSAPGGGSKTVNLDVSAV